MATRKKKNNIGAFGHPIYGKGFAKYGEMQPNGSSEIQKDLEEAAEKYTQEMLESWKFDSTGCRPPRESFIAGAKWQKEQDDKEQADLFTIVALDAAQRAKEQMISALKNDGDLPIEFIDKFHEIDRNAFKNGQENMKEQMMKDAVEGIVMNFSSNKPQPTVIVDAKGFNQGDKVRVIILPKED